MKRLLLKSTLLLCALVIGSLNVWAADTYTKVTDASGLVVGGEYLLVNESAQEALGAITGSSTKIGSAVSVTISSSTISINTETVAVLTLSGSTGSWKFKSSLDNKYLHWASGNSLQTDATGSEWAVTYSASEVSITHKTATDRKLQYNTSNPRFACYTSSQAAVALYRKQVAKTDPTITFNDGSVRVGQNLDLSTLFSSNSDGDVTYSITAGGSNANLVGSTLTGVAEGDVTVKAEQEATALYNAGEATATITVTAALTLSSIAITTPPTKTVYTEGETFDPTGMVVTATYTDASTDDVTASCTFTPSTALTTSDSEITVSYTEGGINKTTTQAITVNEVIDYVTLPFGWDGGTSSELTAEVGVSASGLGDYAVGNAPYRVKFDTTGDYILIKTNTQPGQVTIDVKMLGGANTSSITVQCSADGETFTDVESLSISGAQNDVLTLKTTKAFAADVKYVKLVFTKGSNVGVGPISIALPPAEPSDPVVSGNTVTLTTTANMDGWRAFYDGSKAYKVDANTTIYTVSAAAGSTVTLNAETGEIIPARNAVVLKTTDTGYSMTLTETSDAATLGSNILKASDGSSSVDGYRLGYGAEDGIAFYKYTATAPAAGIVYIPAASLTAPALTIEIGETTGVSEVRSQKDDVSGEYFNLNGQRVIQPTKGLYIVNGRKVLVP